MVKPLLNVINVTLAPKRLQRLAECFSFTTWHLHAQFRGYRYELFGSIEYFHRPIPKFLIIVSVGGRGTRGDGTMELRAIGLKLRCHGL